MKDESNSAIAYSLQGLVLLVGIALLIASYRLNWGIRAWISGIFFINLFVQTVLLSLARIQGFWQPFLQNIWVNIAMIASVVILLLAVVAIALLHGLGILRN
ncbi:hypothetical protein V2H45_15955 [Tumidithrix elongata RA019]|uniref:Uncharacterized protein n=1 Tax=Tumidithrix elongata BACA0141 TaxID=2716417 RepID=A0AAW9Q0U9_9CYAN|nr:hypothetical protein [Tumidithrix elongata RA019]